MNEVDRDEPAGLQIYQLKIELLEIEPLIWRRVLVRGGVTLAQLHEVIQAVMGWNDANQYAFNISGARIGNSEFKRSVCKASIWI